ncbi:MAG: photosystem II reaction center PsbP family protein, partial [Chloroflexi bacterium]|nr:photosystem II reaction center PsbP family protein [Chloroflexota bacterium]
LLVLIVIFTLLAACRKQEVIPEVSQFVPFQDDALGLSLEYPETWATHTSISGLTVASSDTVINNESLADIGNNGFVVIIPGELDVFNFQTAQELGSDDAVRAVAVYKALLEQEGQEYVTVEPPRELAMEGQSAAMMVLRSPVEGKHLITLMAVVINDDYMALVSAASLEDAAGAMRPVFEQIINSIHVTAPAGIG